MMLRKLARTCAPVLASAAVFAGAIGTGEDEATTASAQLAAPRYFQEGLLPEYPNSLEFPIGDNLAVNGLPIRISHFRTFDTAEEVRDFYLEELGRRGLQPTLEKGREAGYAVNATLEGAEYSLTVAISPMGHGPSAETFVFPTVVPLGIKVAGQQHPDAMPFSRDAIGIMSVTDKGSVDGSSTAWQEPTMTGEQVIAGIRDDLGRKGWELVNFEPKKGPGAVSHIELKNGGERRVFTVTNYKHQPLGATVMGQITRGEE